MTTAWMAQRVSNDYASALQQRVRDEWLGQRQRHFDACAARLDALEDQSIVELPVSQGKIGYEAPICTKDARPTVRDAIAAHPDQLYVLAARAGLSQRYLLSILACQYAPRPEIQQRIASALGTTPDALRWPAYLGQERSAS
jgi:lambda repressor-like predicted transcriptional regulator